MTSTLRAVTVGVVIVVSLSGCVSFQFDYVPPAAGATATVRFTSTLSNYYNQRVYVHGQDPCDPGQAKLVGLLDAKAIGQARVNELNITAPAGQPIRVSVPQQDLVGLSYPKVKFAYCQPILTFTPEPTKRYEVEFGMCSARLLEVVGNAKIASTQGVDDRACAISTVNRGDASKGHVFYLKPIMMQ